MYNNRNSFLDSIPPIVKNLIAINFILWLATLALPGIFRRWDLNIDLTDILGMHYWASDKFNIAQMFTYMFMHDDESFNHIFFNMLALFMFGGVLEHTWGAKRFLFYYIFTGFGAAIVQQLFWTVEYQSLINAMDSAISANSGVGLIPYQQVLSHYFSFSNLANFDAASILDMKQMLVNHLVTVGASGSIFGLLLAFGWLFPEERIFLIFFPVPIKARIFVFLYGIAELFLGVARIPGDNIAHFAHLGGILFGIILILLWKKKRY